MRGHDFEWPSELSHREPITGALLGDEPDESGRRFWMRTDGPGGVPTPLRA
jgi:hypothetical protein